MDAQITTIIPTFRRPRLLERAIRSVLCQTYSHMEVHIYDNASGDRTSQLVAELARRDTRVKYHCHPENIGLVGNFVSGIEKVSTPFFNILCDDDVLLPSFFASAIHAFARFPEITAYIGATIDAKMNGEVTDVPVRRYTHGLLQPPKGLFEMLRKGHLDWAGFIFRRDTLSRVGGLDLATGTLFDVDLQLRIAGQYPIFISPSPAAILFSHPEQASAAVAHDSIDKQFVPWDRIGHHLAAMRGLDKHHGELARELFQARLRRRIVRAGGEAVARGSYNEGLKAVRILREKLQGVCSAVSLCTLCIISRVIPAPATRVLTGLIEQTQRVLQKRRYGLGQTLPRRQCISYMPLVRESLNRLGSQQ
ncbi:MAG: glycosyltransferase family 2 protein [Candidatus Binataceae bacterium]|nr:glycosyltransferase family 2 protein [Candidatus Binataceae bacterium]